MSTENTRTENLELAPEQVDTVAETSVLGTPEAPAAAVPETSVMSEAPAASGGAAAASAAPDLPPFRPEPQAAPAAAAAPLRTPAPLPEAPARGVRVGQMLWAAVVILAGLLLIALAFMPFLDLGLVLIALVAVLGVGLIVAALVVGRRSKS